MVPAREHVFPAVLLGVPVACFVFDRERRGGGGSGSTAGCGDIYRGRGEERAADRARDRNASARGLHQRASGAGGDHGREDLSGCGGGGEVSACAGAGWRRGALRPLYLAAPGG